MSLTEIAFQSSSIAAVRRAALVALFFGALFLPHTAAVATQAAEGAVDSGLITLYQHDALASSLDLRTGRHGGQVLGGEVELSAAQLVYGAFVSGQLSFGFAADEAVAVVDLGPALVDPARLAQDAALKFPISAFHTLGASGRRLVFQPAGSDTLVRLGAGNEVFGVPERGLKSIAPKVGHCYALRYQGTRGDRRDMLAKFLVLEHRPGESVTVRFANIGAL